MMVGLLYYKKVLKDHVKSDESPKSRHFMWDDDPSMIAGTET